MRLKIDIDFDKDEIPKDKNRIFISLFKTILMRSDVNLYRKIYGKGNTNRKKFTFALNMHNCKFNRESITIPEKNVSLFFSTADMKLGIAFYNGFVLCKGEEIPYKDVKLKITNITLIKDKVFNNNVEVFKTSSPIVIRKHNKEDNTDWYYDLNSIEGYDLFMDSLRNQLFEELPESKYDLEELKVEVISNKTVKVKHYGIEVLSNLAILKFNAKPYILSHIYNSGLLSFKNAGFGMLAIL